MIASIHERGKLMIGELFTRHGSDKDTYHSYGPVYEGLFRPIRDKVKDLLEIGVCGGGSLRAWAEYFPAANIVGLDNNPAALLNGVERIVSHAADATNSGELEKVLAGSSFDIIVDDGSHWEGHQRESWNLLYWRVRPGGYYVVEDIQHFHTAQMFGELGATIYDRREQKSHFDDILAVFRKPIDSAPGSG